MTAALAKPEPITVRDARPEDYPFIHKRWLHSMEKMPAVHHGAYPHLREELQRLLARLVGRPGVSVRVACDASDMDTLVGCVLTEGATLLFVYVLADFRHMGVARMLTEGIDAYAFSTPAFSRRMKPGVRQWRYLPRLTWEVPEGLQ